MKKSVKIALTILVVLAIAIISALLLQRESSAPAMSDKASEATTKPADKVTSQPTPDTSTVPKGRYADYTTENVANQDYAQTVVFFYAPWCPECRAFKKAITENSIPDGVQILETDFDSSTDLKKKYGVTQQTTFVRVNSAGELQKKWPGYGKDKSIDLVLEGVK